MWVFWFGDCRLKLTKPSTASVTGLSANASLDLVKTMEVTWQYPTSCVQLIFIHIYSSKTVLASPKIVSGSSDFC